MNTIFTEEVLSPPNAAVNLSEKDGGLSARDNQLLTELVERYRGYSKPTDSQKLLLALFDKQDKQPSDYKSLRVLIAAERKAIQAYKQKKKVDDLLKVEKQKLAREANRKKFIVGGAVLAGVRDGKPLNRHFTNYRDLLAFLISDISDADKGKFTDELT